MTALVRDHAGPADESLRIDTWLFRARFYKSRTLAANAVSGGRVHLNEHRVKSARAVKNGDELRLSHPQGRYRLRILGLPSRRGPATESSACYEVLDFEPQRAGGGPSRSPRAAPTTRPDKRGRRRLRALKGRG